MDIITVECLPVTVGPERDGRWWAEIHSMPGVMSYGASRDAAILAVRALALRVAADMSQWTPVPASGLLNALLRIGWQLAWQKDSHRRLKRAGWSDFKFVFQDHEEIGPRLLSQIAKRTGLEPEDL